MNIGDTERKGIKKLVTDKVELTLNDLERTFAVMRVTKINGKELENEVTISFYDSHIYTDYHSPNFYKDFCIYMYKPSSTMHNKNINLKITNDDFSKGDVIELEKILKDNDMYFIK